MVLKEQKLLSAIYQNYVNTGERQYPISLADQNKSEIYNILDNLCDEGFIEYVATAMGFCEVKLTPYGIQFAKNGFKNIEPIPSIQGDNNIVISGSKNNISGNYNKISINIANSDLTDECKSLIQSFLYEMNNPHLTPEKKTDKIKKFLVDISSGTLSNAAASGLTTLLFQLLSQF